MPQYRLYFMNPSSGHIERAEDFHSRDHSEAIEAAAALAGRQPIELWQAGEKLQRFEVTDDRNCHVATG